MSYDSFTEFHSQHVFFSNKDLLLPITMLPFYIKGVLEGNHSSLISYVTLDKFLALSGLHLPVVLNGTA